MTNQYVLKTKLVTAIQYHPAEQRGELAGDVIAHRLRYLEDGTAEVRTPYEFQIAKKGDWIVRDFGGDLRVVDAATFAAFYMPVGS